MNALIKIEPLTENRSIAHFIEAMRASNLLFFAHDFSTEMGYTTEEKLDTAIRQMIGYMLTSHIELSQNIQPIYRCSAQAIYKDWKLSRLALSHLILNAPQKTSALQLFELHVLNSYFSKN